MREKRDGLNIAAIVWLGRQPVDGELPLPLARLREGAAVVFDEAQSQGDESGEKPAVIDLYHATPSQWLLIGLDGTVRASGHSLAKVRGLLKPPQKAAVSEQA